MQRGERGPRPRNPKTRHPRQKKGGAFKAWKKEFKAAFRAADEDESPLFEVKLGKTAVDTYPQEIQLRLRSAYENIESGGSQEIDYDMGSGWVFKLRLFHRDEMEAWEPHLKKHGVGYVGAQWDSRKTKMSPPNEFDEQVQHRPITIRPSRERTPGAK